MVFVATVTKGQPYITESRILKDMIPPPSFLSNVMNNLVLGPNFGTAQPVSSNSVYLKYLTSRVPWRANNIKYINNEIFIDVIESISGCYLTDNSYC